jgi:hypothetical protein
MVTAKIKATTTVHKFLLAHNSRNPSFGRTKSLFIQKKQTNCYLIAVTLRLGLSSQVTRAHFVSTRVIFPLLFSIASKDLQYWLAFETPDWLSGTELSYHVYLLTMLLHQSGECQTRKAVSSLVSRFDLIIVLVYVLIIRRKPVDIYT